MAIPCINFKDCLIFVENESWDEYVDICFHECESENNLSKGHSYNDKTL